MARKIYITEADKQKLQKLISHFSLSESNNKEYVENLDSELSRAQVVKKSDIPNNIITMNSKVLLLLDGEDEEVLLVYPSDADISDNRISVLSPIGTAILGYREGDIIEWKVPSGVTKIEVKKVLYQPEASGSDD